MQNQAVTNLTNARWTLSTCECALSVLSLGCHNTKELWVKVLPTWAARRAHAVAWVPSLPRRICQLYLSSRGTGTLLTLLRILPAILWQSGEQNQAPAQPKPQSI